jgi:antitoxin component YwqK of YwqJK toxin-antitoxin module
MKRLIIAVLIAGIALTACKREISSKELDIRGETYYQKGETTPYSGEVVDHDSNGTLVLKATILNGKYDGHYISWFPNGQKQDEGDYKNDKKVGNWTHWFESGSKMEFDFDDLDNKDEGIAYRAYHKNGTLYQVGNWETVGEALISNGLEVDYDSIDGRKIKELNYVDGVLHGQYTTFYENGKVNTTGKYVNGKKDGEWISYNQNGKVEKKNKYKKGVVINPNSGLGNARLDAYLVAGLIPLNSELRIKMASFAAMRMGLTTLASSMGQIFALENYGTGDPKAAARLQFRCIQTDLKNMNYITASGDLKTAGIETIEGFAENFNRYSYGGYVNAQVLVYSTAMLCKKR